MKKENENPQEELEEVKSNQEAEKKSLPSETINMSTPLGADPVYAVVNKLRRQSSSGPPIPPRPNRWIRPDSNRSSFYRRMQTLSQTPSSRLSRISCDVVWTEDEEGNQTSTTETMTTFATVRRNVPNSVQHQEEISNNDYQPSVSLRSNDYQYLAEAPFSCQTSIVPVTRNQFYLVVQINMNGNENESQNLEDISSLPPLQFFNLRDQTRFGGRAFNSLSTLSHSDSV